MWCTFLDAIGNLWFSRCVWDRWVFVLVRNRLGRSRVEIVFLRVGDELPRCPLDVFGQERDAGIGLPGDREVAQSAVFLGAGVAVAAPGNMPVRAPLVSVSRSRAQSP
jgi:hypothetical protein